MKFTYSIPTKILFGPGSFNDLATTPLPGKKALIVITAGKSMRANGYLDRLIAMLDKQGIGHALFDKILPNPVLRHVHEGAALARARKPTRGPSSPKRTPTRRSASAARKPSPCSPWWTRK